MSNAIRIFIVDDHAGVRPGLRTMLENELDMNVVGMAGSGREALQKVLFGQERHPAVQAHLVEERTRWLIRSETTVSRSNLSGGSDAAVEP